MNKNIKRIIIVCVILIIPFGLMYCCKKPTILAETNSAYFISVPKANNNQSMKFNANIPFYMIVKGNPKLDKLGNNNTIKGDNLKIEGDNVEDIKGATLTLSQAKLADLIKEDEEQYYKTLPNVYIEYQKAAFSDEGIEDPTDEEMDEIHKKYIKNIKKLTPAEAREKVEPYLNSYVITGILSYSGRISNDVSIKSVSVPKYNFKYNFNNCAIEISTENTDGILEDNGNLLEIKNSNKINLDAYISKPVHASLNGETFENIDDINIIEMNEDVILSGGNSSNNTYKKNEKIKFSYDYLINDYNSPENEGSPNTTSGAMASFVYQIKSKGKTYWIPENQAVCTDGKYLIVSCFEK